MHVSPAPADRRRPRLLAIARSRDAELYIVRTDLTAPETTRLSAVLDLLVEMGSVALYRFDTPVNAAVNWQQVVTQLREYVGCLSADAAITAANHPATPTPRPQNLVPVWPFERSATDPEVLTACGLFAGAPITFEAIPVLDADLTEPTPAVARRFAAWRTAVGRRAMLGTVAIAGEEAVHAVFASVRAG